MRMLLIDMALRLAYSRHFSTRFWERVALRIYSGRTTCES